MLHLFRTLYGVAQKMTKQTGGMARAVEHLPTKHKILSSSTSITKKKKKGGGGGRRKEEEEEKAKRETHSKTIT
jgi:hypothetical protein